MKRHLIQAFVYSGFLIATFQVNAEDLDTGPVPAGSESTPVLQFASEGFGIDSKPAGSEQPEIDVDPEELDFGDVFSGESETELVIVSNNGDAALELGTVTLTGDEEFVLISSCSGNSISPGGNCAIVIEFSPDERGPSEAELFIPSNDPEFSQITVPVSGNSIDAVLDLQPESFVFGSLRLGEFADSKMTIRNDGDPGAVLELTSLAIGGDTPGEFAIVDPGSAGTACEIGIELDGGEECGIQIRYEPQELGLHHASLEVDTDQESGSIALQGTGIPAPEQLRLDFVDQPPAIAEPDESFSVRVQARYIDDDGVEHTVDYLEGSTVELSLADNPFGGQLEGITSRELDEDGQQLFPGLSIDAEGNDYAIEARIVIDSEVLLISNFSLAAGESVDRNASVDGVVDSRVAGLDFIGTVSGIGVDGTWASDLKMEVTGPDGATFSVGGFDKPGDVQWDFFGPGSSEPGTYVSTHPDVFSAGALDEGNWEFTFTHDLAVSNAVMSWSAVEVTLTRQSLVRDGISDSFIVCEGSGTPVQVDYIAQPSNTLVGQVMEPPVAVRVMDCQGSVVTDEGMYLKLEVPGIQPNQIQESVAPVDASGVAEFSGLVISQPGEDLQTRFVQVDENGQPVADGPLGGLSVPFWVRTDLIFIDRFEEVIPPR